MWIQPRAVGSAESVTKRPPFSERTWLYRVAYNVAITHKAKRRHRDRESTLEDVTSTSEHTGDTRLDLFALIRRLSPIDRQLVTLHLSTT